MTERSRSFTDLKIWIQSLITVAIIAVGGYFGVTLLAPELAAPSEASQAGPTLEAYRPGQPGEAQGDAAPSEGTPQPADAGMEPATQEPGSGPDVEPGAETGAAVEGEQPDASAPMTDSMQMPRPGAMGSPAAGEGSVPGGPGQGPPDSRGPGARLTAIAQGTLLPPQDDAIAGADTGALAQLQARMTAIAQGTVQSGDQAGPPAAQTPIPAETPAQQQPSAVAPTTGAAVSQPSAGGVGSALAGGASLPAAARLFAVTRGEGASLYDRPDGDAISDLVAGTALTALARSDDGQWTLVQSADGSGWIRLDQLVLFGAENLPMLSDLEASASLSDAAVSQGGQVTVPTAPAPPDAAESVDATASSGAGGPVLGDYIEPVLATVASLNNRLNVRAGPGTDFDIL